MHPDLVLQLLLLLLLANGTPVIAKRVFGWRYSQPLDGDRRFTSGRPLFGPSTRLLGEMYRLTGARLPIIGVGGIMSGADAYAKIRAGAALVQLYTGMVYRGPGLVARIKRELAARLRADGFARLADAVGADHRGLATRGAA